jgi:hypothetical protein
LADDAHSGIQATAQYGRDQLVEQRLVPGLRVVPARQLRKRQRAFGERLEHQHRGSAAADQGVDDGAGGIGAVSGEAGSATDQQRPFLRGWRWDWDHAWASMSRGWMPRPISQI